MEQRHTLSGLIAPRCPAVRNVRQLVPWIGLAVVLGTGACGFDRAASAIASTAPVVPASLPSSNPAVNGGELLVQPSLRLEANSASWRRVVVLITTRDSTTGDRIQVPCVTDSDRVASDALLVDIEDLRNVASRVCLDGTDSVETRQGTVRTPRRTESGTPDPHSQ